MISSISKNGQRTVSKMDMREKVKRIYVPLILVMKGKQRKTLFFHDTGSDINLIDLKSLENMDKNWRKWTTIEVFA